MDSPQSAMEYSFRGVSRTSRPDLSFSMAIIRVNYISVARFMQHSEGRKQFRDITRFQRSKTFVSGLDDFFNFEKIVQRFEFMLSSFPLHQVHYGTFAVNTQKNLSNLMVMDLIDDGIFLHETEVNLLVYDKYYGGEEAMVSFEADLQKRIAEAAPASMYAVETLQRREFQFKYFEEYRCLICQERFSPGKKIVEMPCSGISGLEHWRDLWLLRLMLES